MPVGQRQGRWAAALPVRAGAAHEHQDPHLVAAWDLESAAELVTLEPEVLSGEGAQAVREFRAMTSSMELATVLRPASVTNRMVWHCPLRVVCRPTGP